MILRELLFPMRMTYEASMGLRNWAFNVGLRKPQKVDAKVIAIGNVTVGGTGKTPLTMALLGELTKRGYSVGVVSRGYRRDSRGVLAVQPSGKAAQLYGDEPAMIKTQFPNVPVYVGNRRVEAARALLAEQKVDFIISDDSFQHRKLDRDLNLLLLDATEALPNYRVLPVGRAREAVQPAMQRADFVFLTKCNLVSQDQLKAFRDWVEARCSKPLILTEYRVRGFRSLQGEFRESLSDPAVLVSGVARPEAVEKTVADRVKILHHSRFPDHHRYKDLEVEELLDLSSQLQARWVVTTAKDTTKLAPFSRLQERLWTIELDLHFDGPIKDLYEACERLARSSD